MLVTSRSMARSPPTSSVDSWFRPVRAQPLGEDLHRHVEPDVLGEPVPADDHGRMGPRRAAGGLRVGTIEARYGNGSGRFGPRGGGDRSSEVFEDVDDDAPELGLGLVGDGEDLLDA